MTRRLRSGKRSLPTMESYRPFGIGMGVVIIMAAWAFVAALLMLFNRLPRFPVLTVGPILVVAAALFTFILITLPHKGKDETENDITIYDDTMVRRLGLLVVMAVTFVLGLKLLVMMHLRCPHRAQRLNRRHVDYFRRA